MSVIFDTSMSLDGFMTGANVGPDAGLGDDGERLHDWALGADEEGSKLLAREVQQLGAVICGRRTYDLAIRWWGTDGPTAAARVPVVVLSHRGAPDDVPEGGVYTFADGVEAALEQARAIAGEKNISVMGGAKTGQQFIRAGLVDEIWIHLNAVLFGSGTRMFENIGDEHLTLETLEVIATEHATHLHFRVVRDG